MRSAIFLVVLRGLEALKKRVGAGVVGDVREEVVGERGDGTRLDLGGRQLGADEVGRGGLGQGEDFALGSRSSELALDVHHGMVVLAAGRLAIGAHQVAGGGGDFPAERFDMSGLGRGHISEIRV